MQHNSDNYTFIHKRLGYKFRIDALSYYHAIDIMQRVLGAEKYWIEDYICLSNGQVRAYKAA
jgi:hypothetical protein